MESKDVNNSSVYQQLLDIANGTKGGTGYEAVKNAQGTYDNLTNYYNQYGKDMSSGEYNLYSQLLGTANNDLSSAQSYYAQYLENANAGQQAKANQYAAQQNAYKYMQDYLNAQGLGSQGVAQSTMAGIGNTYASNVAQIDNTLASNQNSLYNAMQESIRNNKVANEQLSAQQKSLEQENLLNNIDTIAENIAYDIANGKSESEVKSKINKLNIPEYTKDSLYNQLQDAVEAKKQQETDKIFEKFDIDKETKPVDLDLNTNKELKNFINNSNFNEGEIFKFNNKSYVITNEKVYSVSNKVANQYISGMNEFKNIEEQIKSGKLKEEKFTNSASGLIEFTYANELAQNGTLQNGDTVHWSGMFGDHNYTIYYDGKFYKVDKKSTIGNNYDLNRKGLYQRANAYYELLEKEAKGE